MEKPSKRDMYKYDIGGNYKTGVVYTLKKRNEIKIQVAYNFQNHDVHVKATMINNDYKKISFFDRCEEPNAELLINQLIEKTKEGNTGKHTIVVDNEAFEVVDNEVLQAKELFKITSKLP